MSATITPDTQAPLGLTTGEAPFIEAARHDGKLYIRQPYELYTTDNHEAWRRLYARMRDRWDRYANSSFVRGLETLHIDPRRVPRLADVNRFLAPLTGFQAKPVSGYVPAYVFFDCLRRREFPTTITIRDRARLDYLPEPDIFHDVAGHVPMHTDPEFAEVLVRFGECAHAAARRIERSDDSEHGVRRTANVLKAMARFFWFTIEFGLIRENNRLVALGSGLLSSYGEIAHAIDSDDVQRFPIRLEWVVNQSFEIHHFQPLLFYVESFGHLFELVEELEHWMLEGRLDNVAPGEPDLSDADFASFLSQSSGMTR